MEFVIIAKGKAEARGAVNTALSIKSFHEEAEVYLFTDVPAPKNVFTDVGTIKNYKEVGVEITPGYLLTKSWGITAKDKTIIGDGYKVHSGEETTKPKKKQTFMGHEVLSNYKEIKNFQLFGLDINSWPQYYSYYDSIIKKLGGYKSYSI